MDVSKTPEMEKVSVPSARSVGGEGGENTRLLTAETTVMVAEAADCEFCVTTTSV